MECKDNSLVGNVSEVFVKEEVNEGQWWQEDMSSEIKCKSEELPISELHSCSSATVTESKANVVYSNGHKMDFKKEIKEEPGCLDISTEVKSESERSSVTDTHFENKAKNEDSWIVGIDEDFPLKISPRLHVKSMCSFGDNATHCIPNKNSTENICCDSDTNSEYQLLNSNQQQKFEESKTKFTSASGTKSHKDKNLFNYKMSEKRCTQNSDMRNERKRPHTCGICNKSFTRKSHLKGHILTHEGKRPHTCGICNKSFTRMSHLKCHIITHEGKRLHTCTVCKKTFTQASHLKRHILIHEGKRPHKCKICKWTFVHRSALKQHEFTHEGRRPHACEICNKRYTHVTTLKRHKLIHEGKKPFTCDVCMKSFIQSSSLKEHKLIHEGKQPHICDICNKNFSNNSNLRRHKSTHEIKNS